MTERNAAGELTSVADPGQTIPEFGLIDHIRSIDRRLHCIEEKLWPKADGSGTERYADGSGTERYADNWTQISNGKDYPGSYGVGPDGQPLKPWESKVVGNGPAANTVHK